MLGTYRVQPGALRFEPQFPLEPGLSYRAVFHPDQLPGEDHVLDTFVQLNVCACTALAAATVPMSAANIFWRVVAEVLLCLIMFSLAPGIYGR